MIIKEKKYKNYLYILPLLAISFYYSIDKFVARSAVDGGLILSETVKFPNDFSNVISKQLYENLRAVFNTLKTYLGI